jgi:hypothetical protein
MSASLRLSLFGHRYICAHGYCPLLEEPLRNVVQVLVALTPFPQLLKFEPQKREIPCIFPCLQGILERAVRSRLPAPPRCLESREASFAPHVFEVELWASGAERAYRSQLGLGDRGVCETQWF